MGDLNKIPQGWHLCDGTDGTPNLLDGRFLEGATTIGIYKEAGLPDAKGRFSISDKSHAFWEHTGYGVFSPFSYGHPIGRLTTDSYTLFPGNNAINFALSNDNAIYGKSNTVQPSSYTVYYIIKIK